MERSKGLKALLTNGRVDFAMEAHDGLSAKIVQEAGFELIWGSGLSISAALGHRDCNELSWTQMCAQFEFMADATSIPILVDGDTGYGNFNNVQLLVKKLCQIGISGVCLEDKLFPKTNSFLAENQPLACLDEFCGKIQAAKDSQRDPNFCVVARTEAFIAGRGLEEALDRAYAYEKAGADAILVHSKQSTAVEIEAFCNRWEGGAPLVVVPTKYASTPLETYERLDIYLVIWANHMLRASVYAMQEAAQKVQRSRSVAHLDLAPIERIFALTGQKELENAEALYLP